MKKFVLPAVIAVALFACKKEQITPVSLNGSSSSLTKDDKSTVTHNKRVGVEVRGGVWDGNMGDDPDTSPIGCIGTEGICYIVITPKADVAVKDGVYVNDDNTPIQYEHATVLKVEETKTGTATYIDKPLNSGVRMNMSFDELLNEVGL